MTFMVTATLRSPRKVKMAARVFTCRAHTREKFVRGQLHRNVCVCVGGVCTQSVLWRGCARARRWFRLCKFLLGRVIL